MKTRRDFLAGSAALGAGLLVEAGAQAPAPSPAEPFTLSLAEWSLHRALRGGELDHLDLAQKARSFGIDAVEYVNQFFMERAPDFAYLEEMKRRAEDAGVTSVLIMIDGEGDLADADDARRRKAVERHFKWAVAARYLGCHSIRVNAAGTGEPDEQMKRAADSLNALAGLAEPYQVNVLVENHGGLSSNGAWLAGVMRLAANPRVGTLPDFGNFEVAKDQWYDRYQGVAELMPFAKAVSAKSHAFDAAGEETRTDYLRMLRIVVGAGYHGRLGIEFEGDGISEDEGIKRTLELLLRVRERLA
jgi:L-ribulose-5-phosphate 3-epimerase